MKVYSNHSLYDGETPCALTLGTFDGVHLGHQKVIKQMVQYAQKHSCPAVLFTFDSHPLEWTQPESGVKRLFSIDELSRNMDSAGVHHLIIQKFSKGFSEISASVFFEKYVYEIFKPACIFAGYDLKFGRNRQGNIEFLKKYAQKFSFQVQEVNPEYLDGKIISSSRIREAFHQSDFEKIHQLRGQPFSFEGEVVSGADRGTRIGFPTANIQTLCTLPQTGVYICQLFVHNHTYHGVMNIGVNPTFESSHPSGELKVEVHLLNQEKLSLRGQKALIFVLKRLRSEKKFKDIPSLQSQIKSDIQKAHIYFSKK